MDWGAEKVRAAPWEVEVTRVGGVDDRVDIRAVVGSGGKPGKVEAEEDSGGVEGETGVARVVEPTEEGLRAEATAVEGLAVVA